MLLRNANVSRWVLIPEALLCFVPLTIGWIDFVAGPSGVVHLNAEIVQKYFLDVPGGGAALAMVIACAALGVFGPVGLVSATGVIARRRPLARTVWQMLIAAPLLLGAIIVATRMINTPAAFEIWKELILLCVLPSVCAAHLLHVSNRMQRSALPALEGTR